MSFELRVARGAFEVVDRRVDRVVCALRVSSAPEIMGAPTHQLSLSPDERWIAVCIRWSLGGLAFVMDASARDAIVDDSLATLDPTRDPPLQWTANGRLRVWSRRADTEAPCWFTYDPTRARWTQLGDRDDETPSSIALASAHRERLDRRASLIESAPDDVRAEVTRILDRRAAKELFSSADPRNDPARARAIYTELVARTPDWSEPHRALAALLDDAREWNAMRDACLAWRAAIPTDPRALAEHAAASLRSGDPAECARSLAQLELEHGDPRSFMDNEAFDRLQDVPELARWS